MKQKDLPLLIAIVIFSIIVSLIVSTKIFTPQKNRMQKVEVVPVVSSKFPAADPTYFNNDSIDPTQLIQISNSNNQNPF